MIEVSTRFSLDFIETYYNHVSNMVFTVKLKGKTNTCDEFERFIWYVSSNFNEIILSEFNELLMIQNHLNSAFPILCECYNPEFFFNGIDLQPLVATREISIIHLRGQENLNRIESLKNSSISELLALNDGLNSHFLSSYISELSLCNEAESIKNSCKKILKLFSDFSIDFEQSPVWVKNIKEIFSYESMPTEVLRRFGDELSLDFCPMCNESQVGNITEDDRTYRQALDHFLPKSKYPILSLSIYNLIPCCNTCNSIFKKDKDTFSPLHANPYISGADNYNLFDINSLMPNFLYGKNTRVKFLKTNTEIDNNVKLFKLNGVYNKRATKSEIIRIISLFNDFHNGWKNFMSYDEFIIKVINYDQSKSLYQMSHGKFKKDLIDFMKNAGY